MPGLIRFLLSAFSEGAVVGLGFAEVLLFADVGGLGGLLAASAHGGAVTALFFLEAALLFGALGINVSVLTLPYTD